MRSGTTTFHVNVTGNYLLAQEAKWVFEDQKLTCDAWCSPVPQTPWCSKRGSEAYDVSKTALNHLIRELAVGLGPAGAGEWNRARHCGGRVHHVPARPRHAVADRNTRSRSPKTKPPKSCVISWQTSTRSAR